MAYRIHVTAIRNCATDTIRKTFCKILGEEFCTVPLQESGRWVSFQTSVWSVSSKDLIKGLCELEKPGLQFTTEDAACWYVTFCDSGKDPETLIHNFDNHDGPVDKANYDPEENDDMQVDPELAFLEDDPEKSQKPKTAFDIFAQTHAELGIPLPEELLEEARELSFKKAIERFREWHENRILSFLEAADVDVDAEAVRRVLSWQVTTETELDSDIGNLPRLLSVIGLGGSWDDYIEKAGNRSVDGYDEEDEEDEVEEDDGPSPDWIAPAEKLLGKIELVEVEGGPVELPMKQFHLVGFFPEACQAENDIIALLNITIPESADHRALESMTGETSSSVRIEFARLPHGFKIGFENHLLVENRHINEELGKNSPLAKSVKAFFKNPPQGTVMECVFGAEDAPATRQAFRGVIDGKTWHIDATSPALPAPVLEESLQLAVDAPKTNYALRDEAEADAIMQAVAKDSYLHGMGVKRKGRVVWCEYDVEFLAKLIFRHRYRDYWDIESVEKRIEADYQERIELEHQTRRKIISMVRDNMAPRIGDPIYEGIASIYWRSELSHFSSLDAEPREVFEKAMQTLNFTLLGEMTPKKFRDYVLLCYVSPDRLTYGCLTASIYGYLCWDFVSDLSDGSRLSTTTSPLVFSRPAVKLYYKDFLGLPPEELYEKHLQLLERFRTNKNATPAAYEASLVGLAKVFDDSVVRTEEDERNSPDEDDDYDDDDDDDDEEFDDEDDDDEEIDDDEDE